MKNTLEINENFSNINIVNGWEITKIVSANKKKNNNRVNFLYYVVN